MIRVNLLPHREMRRRRLQQQFVILLLTVMLLGAGAWVVVHTSLTRSYENQIGRNDYLKSEIAKLDKEIEDIKKLKEMTAALLARKRVVETLQSNRSDVVHLMDELARELPDGIYLKAIKQQGARVTITGLTQSQARVSTLMRNLEASPHLENASLVEIKAIAQTGPRLNEFTLNISIERPKDELAETPKLSTATTAAGAR
jgi:type IV pilus assembly protein PilN